MRAAALVLLVLLSPCALAEDAPLVLTAGDVAPFSGVLVPDALSVARARELSACRVEVPVLREAALAAPSPALVVVVAVVAVVVGAAVGYTVAVVVR